MNNWGKKLMKWVLPLIVMVSFFSFQSGIHAASVENKVTQVGQALATADAGWKRYEESASGFTFEGPSWLRPASGNYSGVTEKYTLNPSLHAVKFNFKGTALRIISYRGTDRQKSVNVNIDGIDYNYSANGPAQITTLHFEKINLEDKLHSVVISAINSGTYQIFEFDAIDIDESGYLSNNTLSAPVNLTATAREAKVDLNWTAVSNATSYIIKRGTTAGGPYETIAANVTSTVYTDPTVTTGVTYFYVSTAVNADGESGYSNEVSVTPQKATQPDPEPSGDRAILTITLTTGLEKEFDLSITEVNAFLNWYDARDSGSGPAKFAIDKHQNNKGSFSKRTEYVIFDKILTFNVDEYSIK